MFVQVAITGRADVIVSEDKDLLVLDSELTARYGIRVVTAVEFLRLLVDE
jgi:predicted nucleic acid-binding protein